MITDRILEIIFSLFLGVICVWVILEGYALSLGELDDIGSGFLLFCEAILMGIMLIACIAKAFRNHSESPLAFPSYQALGKVALTIIIILITAVFFEAIGFVFMASIFMVVLLRFVGRERWVRLSIVTIATVLLSYSIFSLLLNIQLPSGPFGF